MLPGLPRPMSAMLLLTVSLPDGWRQRRFRRSGIPKRTSRSCWSMKPILGRALVTLDPWVTHSSSSDLDLRLVSWFNSKTIISFLSSIVILSSCFFSSYYTVFLFSLSFPWHRLLHFISYTNKKATLSCCHVSFCLRVIFS